MPKVFSGDDEYLRHLEKQYQMSRSLERQSKPNNFDEYPTLSRTLSETQLNGTSVPADRIKKSYQAQLEYELRRDPTDKYDTEEYFNLEEIKDSTYTTQPLKPVLPPVRKKVRLDTLHYSMWGLNHLLHNNQCFINLHTVCYL